MINKIKTMSELENIFNEALKASVRLGKEGLDKIRAKEKYDLILLDEDIEIKEELLLVWLLSKFDMLDWVFSGW